MALPPMPPPAPPLPTGPNIGSTSPAAPGQADRSGKEARGRVQAGLALEMARMAIPNLGNTKEGLELAAFIAKFGKHFLKPEPSLGKSELTYMGSQMFGGGGASAQGPPPDQGMPPSAPPLPSPPMGAMAAA